MKFGYHSGMNGSFEPASLHMLGEMFDEVWACIAPDIGNRREDVEAARNRLAAILLKLAKDGQFGPLQITRTSARLMREQ